MVRSEEGKRRLTEATYSGNKEVSSPQKWLKTAPVIIVIAADHRPVMKRYGRKGLDELLYLDCACAVENMLLGAVHLGLSSCFISGFREHEMAEALGLPEYMQPIALLPVGYAAGPGVLRPAVPPEEVTCYEAYEAKHV